MVSVYNLRLQLLDDGRRTAMAKARSLPNREKAPIQEPLRPWKKSHIWYRVEPTAVFERQGCFRISTIPHHQKRHRSIKKTKLVDWATTAVHDGLGGVGALGSAREGIHCCVCTMKRNRSAAWNLNFLELLSDGCVRVFIERYRPTVQLENQVHRFVYY